MSKRIAALSAVSALTLTAIASATAMAGSADHTDAVSIPGVIGAAYNSPTRADGAADVRRQGGFVTAGAVRWLAEAPAAETAARSTFNSPGVMGAMSESRGLARSADEVRRQGGFATAAAVHWLAKAPAAKKVAAS
jgi:hypothetical protein